MRFHELVTSAALDAAEERLARLDARSRANNVPVDERFELDGSGLMMLGEMRSRAKSPAMRFYGAGMGIDKVDFSAANIPGNGEFCYARVEHTAGDRIALGFYWYSGDDGLRMRDTKTLARRYRNVVSEFLEQCMGGFSAFRPRSLLVAGVEMDSGFEQVWRDLANEANSGCQAKNYDSVVYRLRADSVTEDNGHVLHSRVPGDDVLTGAGLHLSKLGESDVALVNKEYPYSKDEDDSSIRKLVTTFPSSCVRKNGTNELVAWCLCHSYGALGALHVIAGWRRRGLGTLLLRAQAAQIADLSKARESPLPIYAFVVASNTASRGMFERMSPQWVQLKSNVTWLLF
jgi:GNAT superfamily N-acetyltransferase